MESRLDAPNSQRNTARDAAQSESVEASRVDVTTAKVLYGSGALRIDEVDSLLKKFRASEPGDVDRVNPVRDRDEAPEVVSQPQFGLDVFREKL